jgi:putative (di)nucleoside polyphosphate hydrolase
MPSFEELPYRRCVGVMVLNKAGLVFVGERKSAEHIDSTLTWQMPQGGIDPGEDPWPAAVRELYEETNIRSVERLGEVDDWLSYDIPAELRAVSWSGGKYRGQTQKWFVLRFTGDDGEIDVLSPGGGAHKPEFRAWKWEPMANVPGIVVPFKRLVYERVVKEFGKFAGA